MKTSTLNTIAILATVASLVVGDTAFAHNFGSGSGSSHSSSGSSFKGSFGSSVKSSSGSSKMSSSMKTVSSNSNKTSSNGSNKTTSNKTASNGNKTTNSNKISSTNGNKQNGSNSNKQSKTDSSKTASNSNSNGNKTSGSNGNKQFKTDSNKTASNSNGKNSKHDGSNSKHDHHGCFSDFFCSNYCCPSYGCYSDCGCYSPSYCESYCEPCYCEQSGDYADSVAPVYGDASAPVAGGQAPVAGGDQAPVTGQTADAGQAFEPFHSTYNTLPGDSFYTVSLKEYGTSAKASAIAQFNGMSEDAALTPGQQLTLPSIAADGTLSQSSSPVAETFAAPATSTAAAPSVPATPASFTTAAGSDDDAARTKVPAGSTLLVDGQNFGSKPGSARLRIGGGFLKIAVAQWTPNAVKVSLPKADQAGSTDADLEILRADGSTACRTAVEISSPEQVASNN